jgi:hypothetical protein
MSDKSNAAAQDIDALTPGQWIWFTPLSTGWGPGANGWALARYCPADNSVEIVMDISRTGTNSAHAVDGYQIATMPAADADGNQLRPVQTMSIACTTDFLQTSTPGSPRIRVAPDGTMKIYGVSSSSTWLRADCQHYSLDDLNP